MGNTKYINFQSPSQLASLETGTETTSSLGALINNASEKDILISEDMFSVRDSESGFLQKFSFVNLKSVLKTYFDSLYNNYIHPVSHSPSIISQDSNNRFVSDNEKTTWNAKQPATTFKTINGNAITGSGDIVIAGEGGTIPETVTSIGTLIDSSEPKSELADNDNIAVRDNVSRLLQKLSYTSLKTNLKSYFDTLYNNYSHPANHSPSVISQDSSNRFVSDTEKASWNGKSNFSGNYSDLSGKPTLFDGSYSSLNNKPIIPTALADLTPDDTHHTVTLTQISNIPLNTKRSFSISDANNTIEFDVWDILTDTNFVANTSVTTGNKTITISNPVLNKVVTILFPKITDTTVIILPNSCNKLQGDFSTVLQNVLMIHCISVETPLYLYTISQIQ